MEQALLWLGIALALCAIEVVTADLIFASFALGAFAGCVTHVLGGDVTDATVVAALISLMSLFVIRPAAKKRLSVKPEARTGVAGLIGQQAVIESPTTARLHGETWTLAAPLGPEFSPGDSVIVRGVRGASLEVAPMSALYTDPGLRKDLS